MGFYKSPFGNGVAIGSGGNVNNLNGDPHNQFGPRDTGGTVGGLHVDGIVEELVIDFTGQDFNDIANTLVPYVIPAGAVIKEVLLDVTEAFTLSGTTPALETGTKGSEATNGFTTSSANLSSTGFVNLTSALSGTWDAEAPLAADTTVSFVLSGTTPAMTNAGKARFTIIYERSALKL